jgi:hypothetical protein
LTKTGAAGATLEIRPSAFDSTQRALPSALSLTIPWRPPSQ